MRVFVCSVMPEETVVAIGKIQDRLKRSGLKLKWTHPSHLHFTLCFLGDTNADEARQLPELLRDALAQQSSFAAKLQGLGAFPRPEHARVLWLGVSDGAKELSLLAHTVADVVKNCGLSYDSKPFNPHLTIGRARTPVPLHLPPKAFEPVGFTVNAATVMESQLTPQGPIYTPVGTIALKPES